MCCTVYWASWCRKHSSQMRTIHLAGETAMINRMNNPYRIFEEVRAKISECSSQGNPVLKRTSQNRQKSWSWHPIISNFESHFSNETSNTDPWRWMNFSFLFRVDTFSIISNTVVLFGQLGSSWSSSKPVQPSPGVYICRHQISLTT